MSRIYREPPRAMTPMESARINRLADIALLLVAAIVGFMGWMGWL